MPHPTTTIDAETALAADERLEGQVPLAPSAESAAESAATAAPAATAPTAPVAAAAATSPAAAAKCGHKRGRCHECGGPCRQCGCSCPKRRRGRPPGPARQQRQREARKRKAVSYAEMDDPSTDDDDMLDDPPTGDDDVLYVYGKPEEKECNPRSKRREKAAKKAATAKTTKKKGASPKSARDLKAAREMYNQRRNERRQQEAREKREAKFQERLAALRSFQEEMGHCNATLGGNGTGRDDYKELGIWLRNLRALYRKKQSDPTKYCRDLTDENVAALDALGFEWLLPNKTRQEEQWDQQFEKLRRYKEQFGTTNVGHCYKEENEEMYSLGGWVRTQKYAQRDGKLSEERKSKLDGIGFDFVVRGHKELDKRKWDAKYEKLKRFYEENGHSRVPKTHSDSSLVKFCKQSRETYGKMEEGGSRPLRGPPLTADMIERLRALNFDFSVRPDRKRKTWEERYEQLGEFFVENGHCHVPCRYSKVLLLPRWVKEQKAEFRKLFDPEQKSKLTLERYRKLEELGFQFVAEGMETERCSAPWSFCTCDFDGNSRPARVGGMGRKRNARPWEAATDAAAVEEAGTSTSAASASEDRAV